MLDVTEYQFHAPDWLLVVRGAKTDVDMSDLGSVARAYANGMGLFLEAGHTLIGSEEAGPHGGRLVRITSEMPGNHLFAAMLKFDPSKVIELSLIADKNASGAEAEFERLLASTRPAEEFGISVVRRALKADHLGSPDYPAGPLRLNLSTDYQTPRDFTLESADGTERYTFGKIPRSDLEAMAGPVDGGASLAANLTQAVGEDGRVVKFEVPQLPRFSKNSSLLSANPESRETANATGPFPFSGTDTTDAGGQFQVTIRFEGSQANSAKAAELFRQLKSDS